MFKKLDFPAVIALIFLPLTLIVLGILYLIDYQLGWLEILLFISGYYISNITVGIGLHRLWSHDTYKTNKYVEFILAVLAAGTLQGPALSWASNHFKHHTFTDTEKDPHTPLKYENRIKGFFWSHMGWMLAGNGSYKSIDRITMVKLGKNKILRWQLKHYWVLAISMNTIIPAIVGYILGGTMLTAYAGFLFIGLGRALQQQITFFVNSLCHFVGEQPYTKGTSGDVWWLAVLLLGENWHNFHHAFPSDYRNGAKWYQTDVHKWIIYLMSKCGLAWDLKRTAKVRVDAKISQTVDQINTLRKEKLEAMQLKVDELVRLYQEKRVELEASSLEMKSQMYKSFANIQDNLNSLGSQLNVHLRNFDNSSDKIIKIISKKVKKVELSMQKIYQEIENLKTFI
ncbi:MAG: fatty acid desaturase [Rickettsiaceae bacterium]|nr:fatty acid desaturase [Rickettsiaceae bacterium]MDP4832723.1 fatty acid desaturase [Rickettsiaceae bacterium]MDP5021147.1 fatty acid desaturase [Rickettsiaceae bacterium]